MRSEAARATPDVPLGERAWQAVVDRDRRFDGVFVYAVRTTGIFCRPVCSARRPRRENVIFFRGVGEAEAAGYRACRRCRPDAPEQTGAARAVEEAVRYLEASDGRRITLHELGAAVHVSPHHLQRIFTRQMGVSPRQFQDSQRAERLRHSLRSGYGVTGSSYEAGFSSPSRAYAAAGAHLGMTPAVFARGGAGVTVRITRARTPLGALLIGRTERGICLVKVGDSAAALESEARRELPGATFSSEPEPLAADIRAVIDAVAEGSPLPQDLPLDLRATRFRLRVWEALRQIPTGETRTYGEIARIIGSPTAARAVARACAANPLAVVVPCHRVVGSDGNLRGYRWGVERKGELLARERTAGP
jgi:AraC family transcriptional regulator, regulatory protein of adaptative response / methylated-DNA-[protein]-cysteine methyltransferase